MKKIVFTVIQGKGENNERSVNRILKITAFALVIILISTIVGYSIYLFRARREEKISEWGGAESADILDDSEHERYALPFWESTLQSHIPAR